MSVLFCTSLCEAQCRMSRCVIRLPNCFCKSTIHSLSCQQASIMLSSGTSQRSAEEAGVSLQPTAGCSHSNRLRKTKAYLPPSLVVRAELSSSSCASLSEADALLPAIAQCMRPLCRTVMQTADRMSWFPHVSSVANDCTWLGCPVCSSNLASLRSFSAADRKAHADHIYWLRPKNTALLVAVT